MQVQLQGRALGLDRGDTLVSWALSSKLGGCMLCCCVCLAVGSTKVLKLKRGGAPRALAKVLKVLSCEPANAAAAKVEVLRTPRFSRANTRTHTVGSTKIQVEKVLLWFSLYRYASVPAVLFK